jgi:hypothetical protein
VLLATGSALAGEVTLFSERDFQGEAIMIRGPAPNLERIGYNDTASSLIVRNGLWEVCTDARFEGRCVQLPPGEYSSIGRDLNNRISSLREITPVAAAPAPRAVEPAISGNARVVLYQYPNFRGRSVVIDRPEVPRLSAAYFDNGAESMRVEGGTWMFCSNANFSGQCRTFGPGDYAQLPWELDHVASGRFVPDRYSYLR